MPLNKKVRPARIEHLDEIHVEDETTHLWAISYSDFLMVLLSFFVLFFSLNSDDQKNVIQQIKVATKNVIETADSKNNKNSQDRDLSSLQLDVSGQFHKLAFKNENSKDSLEIQFPENIYEKSSLKMQNEYESILKELLTHLKEFDQEIDVFFIGHTDQLKVIQKEGRAFLNNYDLSAIRASRAIQTALEVGMRSDSLYSMGASDHSKNSRTLSLLIKVKGKQL